MGSTDDDKLEEFKEFLAGCGRTSIIGRVMFYITLIGSTLLFLSLCSVGEKI